MLRLSKAFVDDLELKYLEKVFKDTVNFGLGIHVQQFERELSARLETDREVVCVNTGTSALHLALEALGFSKGSEVIVPSLTFVASYQAISAAGLVPVSCDVTFPSGHICAVDLVRRITPKTVAIMPVSYAGADFNRDAVYGIAAQYGLRVIEDNAHAFGGLTSHGRPFGSTGDITCFSFDGIKNITCGEGGAIVTANIELAHSMRVRRSLGIEADVHLRYKGERSWEYDVAVQGFRYHMSNINAAIGSAQLTKLDESRQRKHKIFQRYCDLLAGHEFTNNVLPTQQFNPDINFHIFACLLPKDGLRSELRKALKEHGFESGFHYVPNHTHSLYRSSYHLPRAEEIGARTISLPFHPGVTEADCEAIVGVINKFLREQA